jgi:predicted ATPase
MTGGVSAELGMSVPPTVTAVIQARLERLPDDERRLLQTASVIGRNFEVDALAHLLDAPAHGSDLVRRLRALRVRGFLDGGGGPGRHAYRHALMVEVAYETLLVADRRRLHERLARWIEERRTRPAGVSVPAVLAYHYERAECWEKAFTCSMRAGHEALRMSAAQEAIEHYRRTLRLSTMSSARDGAMPWRPAPQDLCSLYENLAEAYYLVGDYAQAVERFAEALEIVEDPRTRASLHRKRGDAFEKWGRIEDARTCFEAGMSEMGPHIETGEAARIFTGLSRVCYRCGDLEMAQEIAQLALELLEKDQDRSSIADACGILGTVLDARGDTPAALTYHLRSLALREQSEETYGLAAAHNNAGLAYRKLGSMEKACEHLQRSAQLFLKLGNAHGVARAYDNLGAMYFEQGDLERSHDYIQKAVTLLADLSVKDTRDVDANLWQSGAW